MTRTTACTCTRHRSGPQWVVRTPARRLVLRPGAVRSPRCATASSTSAAPVRCRCRAGQGRRRGAPPGDRRRRAAARWRELVGASRGPRRAAIGARPAARRSAASPVRGVTHDSRRVAPGWRVRGHPGRPPRRPRPRAGRRGGGRRRRWSWSGPCRRPGVPQLLVAPSRRALAVCAAWFEGDPSQRLGVVGITGTDGKTTTAYLVRSMLEAAGLPTGHAGHHRCRRGRPEPGQPGSRHDTRGARAPGAPAADGRWRATAGRWSSRPPMAWPRTGSAEVAYDVAVHTNVTHEHLEFHRTPEAYRAAKRRLFERLAVGPANPDKGFGKHAVVNLDDPHAGIFVEAAARRGRDAPRLWRRSRRRGRPSAPSPSGSATAGHHGPDAALGGPRARPRSPAASTSTTRSPRSGWGRRSSLDPGAMRAGLEALERVPGRMETGGPGPAVPGPRRLRPHPRGAGQGARCPARRWPRRGGGRLICVFGSAGDRDVAKRPMMGRVAGERCRLVVVTDEDPRSEDRMAILDAIAAGAERAGRVARPGPAAHRRSGDGHRDSHRRGAPGDVVRACRQGPRAEHRDGRGPGPLGRGGGRAGRPPRPGLRRRPVDCRDGAACRRDLDASVDGRVGRWT